MIFISLSIIDEWKFILLMSKMSKVVYKACKSYEECNDYFLEIIIQLHKSVDLY
jgi:hypothetical protein